MSLRSRAISAFREEIQTSREAARAAITSRIAESFPDTSCMLECIDRDGAEAWIVILEDDQGDRVVLFARTMGGKSWKLTYADSCVQCGQPVDTSRPAGNLIELGAALTAPAIEDRCRRCKYGDST